MRKLWCVLLGVIMVGLTVVPPSQAEVSVNEVAKALKSANVYIAPGVEGTTEDTALLLTKQLSKGDRMVLVMLPEDGSNDPGATAEAIDNETGKKFIVGLSVGHELVATSTIMPDEVARDLMQRAVDTGTNPVERLGTFVRNVHVWQSDHPDEPAAKEKEDGINLSALLLLLSAVFALIAISSALLRRHMQENQTEIKLKASPPDVRDVLRSIHGTVLKIHDPIMRESVEQAVIETEEYFRRSTESPTRKRDASIFAAHLKSVEDVLNQYIDVQNYPHYYDDPVGLLRKGQKALEGFNSFVIESIKDGRRSDLTRFNVDTDILSAQRYS